MNYLDASALVKRFVEERGSSAVDDLVRAEAPATATLSYAEIHAALARKRRDTGLTARIYRLATRQFDQEWTSYIRVELGVDVLQTARLLVQRHPLKGMDAVQLASALVLTANSGSPVTFVAADVRLLRIAGKEGLLTIPVGAIPD